MAADDFRPLPITLEEIDAEWMTRALRQRAPGVTCTGVKILDVNNGTCTKIRLALDMDEAGKQAGIPDKVILKGGFETHSRGLGFMHELEVVGYRDIMPFVDFPSPACYFTGYDEDRQQGIVVLEDLTQRGVEFCSALRPQPFEQVQRQLSALAKLHASAWGESHFSPGARLAHLGNSERSLRNHMRIYLDVPSEWKRFVDSPRGASTSAHFHDVKRISAAYDKLVAFSDTLPHCLVHGDTHLGNVYAEPDGSPGFFDCVPSIGCGLREVSYHMTVAIDSGDRKRWEGALIQHYLSELRANGVDAPSFDDAFRQYRAFLLVGFVIFMVNESNFQTEAYNTACAARFGVAMVDHDTLGLLEAL